MKRNFQLLQQQIKNNTEVGNVIQNVREFNILRSLSEQLNSKSYCIGHKIEKVHLEFISEWLIKIQNKNFTFSKLRLDLLKEFPKIRMLKYQRSASYSENSSKCHAKRLKF